MYINCSLREGSPSEFADLWNDLWYEERWELLNTEDFVEESNPEVLNERSFQQLDPSPVFSMGATTRVDSDSEESVVIDIEEESLSSISSSPVPLNDVPQYVNCYYRIIDQIAHAIIQHRGKFCTTLCAAVLTTAIVLSS